METMISFLTEMTRSSQKLRDLPIFLAKELINVLLVHASNKG